jgi:hypothetical protein
VKAPAAGSFSGFSAASGRPRFQFAYAGCKTARRELQFDAVGAVFGDYGLMGQSFRHTVGWSWRPAAHQEGLMSHWK